MTDEEIERFIRRFEETSLSPPEWTHAMHLIVALVYVVRHGRDEATERIRQGIQRLNRRFGNDNGYHETITLAWIAVICRFLDGKERSERFSILSGELIEECGVGDYLLRFYSRDVLMSDDARRTWIRPDLSPID